MDSHQSEPLHSEINDLRQANKRLHEEIMALREQMLEERAMYQKKLETILTKMPTDSQ